MMTEMLTNTRTYSAHILAPDGMSLFEDVEAATLQWDSTGVYLRGATSRVVAFFPLGCLISVMEKDVA